MILENAAVETCPTVPPPPQLIFEKVHQSVPLLNEILQSDKSHWYTVTAETVLVPGLVWFFSKPFKVCKKGELLGNHMWAKVP